MENIASFFCEIFSSNAWLAVAILSMIPTLETKIALPLGINRAIWGSHALSPISALFFSFIGSLIPSFFVMLAGRKIKKHTAFCLHSSFFQKYAIKGASLNNKSSFHKYLALACFVAVPIPLTGVWSGSLIAGLSNLKLSYAFLSIAIGSLISTCIIALLCTVFNNSLTVLLMIILTLIIIFLVIEFSLSILKIRH